MIAGIMVFLAVVSLLLWTAAWAADQGLRRLGLPTRWVWLVGLVSPFALLVVPLLLPSGAPVAGGGDITSSTVFELAPIVVGGGAAGLGLWIPLALGTLWVVSSIALAMSLVHSHIGLTRERERWPTSNVSGRDVYVSSDRGPAVAGVWRPWIVLPRWALRLPARELDFVLLHEEEHLRARDTLLLAGALALVALTPWSPGAWLHLRGLKVAMEVDCDRRVLRRAPDRATYGESLLTVAARSSGLSLGLAAFTEKHRSLKTRILTMTDRATRWTPVRSLLFLAVALLVGLQACYVESPILIIGDADEVAEALRALVDGRETDVVRPSYEPPVDPDLREPSTEELAREPTFTPFTVAPSILNRDEVIAAMMEAYPPLLRDAGIGGTARVYFFIDEEGLVRDVRLDQSTGHPALDAAALAVADVYRFTPARNRDDPTPVWVSFPITFQTR